jgi:aspartate beta-hydroxylase
MTEITDAADLAAREQSALAKYQAGDLSGAAEAFRALLAQAPEHATALEFLGFEASQRADYAAAVDYYRRATSAAPTDATNFFNLAMSHYGLNDLPATLAALEQTLERDSSLIEAQLYRGTVLERMQRPADAALAFLRAVRFAEANLDPQQMPPDLKHYLNHALGVVRAHLDAEIDRSLADLVSAHGADAVARLRKAGDIFVGKRPPEFAHPKWRPGLMYVPDLPPKAFYESGDFDWASRVEAATEMVRAELMNVMTEGRGFAPYVNHPEGSREAMIWKGINQSYDWSTFHFYRHGERIEENCARCPGTAALLESIDIMRVPGYGPEAMFSVLKPHSRIPPHYGTVNGRLIVHLPLTVPENCGALKVAGEARGWEEGKLMVFDDSFEHEAWNDSDQTRVVLIFDTWNPNLNPVERQAFSRVLATAQNFERSALV